MDVCHSSCLDFTFSKCTFLEVRGLFLIRLFYILWSSQCLASGLFQSIVHITRVHSWRGLKWGGWKRIPFLKILHMYKAPSKLLDNWLMYSGLVHGLTYKCDFLQFSLLTVVYKWTFIMSYLFSLFYFLCTTIFCRVLLLHSSFPQTLGSCFCI